VILTAVGPQVEVVHLFEDLEKNTSHTNEQHRRLTQTSGIVEGTKWGFGFFEKLIYM
jgi:hypothetical protein